MRNQYTKTEMRANGWYPIDEAAAGRWMRAALRTDRAAYLDCGEIDLSRLGEACFDALTASDPQQHNIEMGSEHPIWDWAFDAAVSLGLL